MTLIVCRAAWMPSYQSESEDAIGGGSYVEKGNAPHEALNFLPVDDVYYGVVENQSQRLDLNKLGAQTADETVAGVSVIFGAEEPESRDFLVVGWYTDAVAHRHPIQRPGDRLGRTVYFTAENATLVVKSERCFRVPRSGDRPANSLGGIGSHHVWYGLNKDDAAHYRKSLFDYMTTLVPMQPSSAVLESRKRRLSSRLERQGTYRQFIRMKDYRCEACEWSIGEEERDVWGSSFELHHLTPLTELKEGNTRVVCIEDFAVLCASCHRAIHRTDCVSDVARFRQLYM